MTYLQPVHFFDIAPRLAQTWLADFPYHKELGVFCVLGVVSRSCDYINTFQLGYSLDKVYQVGIAKSVHLKFCRTNYARFDATNLEPAPTLKTSPVCVNVAPAYIVRGAPYLCVAGVVRKQDRSVTQSRLEMPTQLRGMQTRVRAGLEP